MIKYIKKYIWICLVLSLVLTGCDFSEPQQERQHDVLDEFGPTEPEDPLDGFSRAMMELNFFLDDYILQPAATAYKALTPDLIQTGIGNFTQYIKIPFYLVNDILQWKWDHFAQNFWVMTVNTFSGFGIVNGAGYFDVYAKPNDFGITLYRWGAGPGFSIALPVLGPTCLRDAVGSFVGFFWDPLSITANYYNYQLPNYGIMGLGYVHRRSLYLGQLESLRKESYDPYVTIKSIAEQQREAELRGSE